MSLRVFYDSTGRDRYSDIYIYSYIFKKGKIQPLPPVCHTPPHLFSFILLPCASDLCFGDISCGEEEQLLLQQIITTN